MPSKVRIEVLQQKRTTIARLRVPCAGSGNLYAAESGISHGIVGAPVCHQVNMSVPVISTLGSSRRSRGLLPLTDRLRNSGTYITRGSDYIPTSSHVIKV